MEHNSAVSREVARELPMQARENALKAAMRDMIDEVEETAQEMAHVRGNVAALEDRIDALQSWDPEDEDGRRMQAEAVQKQAEVHALKARAERLMLDLLQKIVTIEENMEVRCRRRPCTSAAPEQDCPGPTDTA